MIIVDLTEIEGYTDEDSYILINPEILEEKGEQIEDEGCLSFPNLYGKVKRPLYIKVKALNENGEEYILEGYDLLSQAISHEIDHLNGVVFVDKVEPDTLWKDEEVNEG